MTATRYPPRPELSVLCLDGPLVGRVQEVPACGSFVCAVSPCAGVVGQVRYELAQFVELVSDTTVRVAWFASAGDTPEPDEPGVRESVMAHLRAYGRLMERDVPAGLGDGCGDG